MEPGIWVQFQRTLLIIAGVVLALLVVAGVVLNSSATRWVRNRTIAELDERFDADVKCSDLKVTVFPGVSATGRNLVIRRRDNPEQPFITIREFSASASLAQILFSPRYVRLVHLDGLVIEVFPRPGDQPSPPRQPKESPVVVDRVVSDRARLIIHPQRREKAPLVFDIHQLEMHDVGLDRAAPFEARLTNAKPSGEIHVKGRFGPWRASDPGQTPVAAAYSVTGADLGVFRGIGGILSSTGRFAGPLERLEVHGEADTPEFTVGRGGHRVNLHARFHAVVDGANGNTLLDLVDAEFLSSSLTADGGAIADGRESARTVQLDVAFTNGRIEDVIRLATPAETPPLTGPLAFRTKFELPPGDGDVMDRLLLDGQFGLGEARFTSLNVQEKFRTLSRKGQGRPDEQETGSDVSQLAGQFTLRDGVLHLSNLRFQVEGAAVLLNGSYALRTEELDLHGTLRLAAAASQATTGIKSFFLRLIDPLFRRKRVGAEIPIKITGTRENPQFGLDVD